MQSNLVVQVSTEELEHKYFAQNLNWGDIRLSPNDIEQMSCEL